MKVKPLHDRILVKRIEEGEQVVGASSSRTPPRKSPSRARWSRSAPARSTTRASAWPSDVKDGDKILFGKYSGQEIKLDGEEFLIMREDEVLG